MGDHPTTQDAFLGGKVMLVQPANGAHRSGSDAVFLAACLHNAEGGVLDMGAGAGAVGLMVAHLAPRARVALAERDPAMLDCCTRSVREHPSLSDRVQIIGVDLLAPEPKRTEAGLQRAQYDHVVSNPPYRKAGHVRTNPAKQSAHVLSDDELEGWMRTAASVLKPGGTLTLIFAADGLMDLMRVFAGRFGAVAILGLHPRKNAPAERLLVRAVKGRRTPPRILPGLILHEPDGTYTQQAQAILAGKNGLDLNGGV